jgi:hypothetical protein
MTSEKPGSQSLPDLLYWAQTGRCFHCNEPMDAGQHRRANPSGWTREHVFPKSRGGRSLENNFVLAHVDCNNRRGSRHPNDAEIVRAMRLYRAFNQEAFTIGGWPLAELAAVVLRCQPYAHAPDIGFEIEAHLCDPEFAVRRLERFFAGADA